MIISFSGPSGIGKGFVKEQLLRIYPNIKELVWVTTRPLRPGEKGGNRVHTSPSKFDKLVESGKLILVQDLYGYYYGLRKEDLLPGPNTRLTELHPNNLVKALKINPAIFAIGFVTYDFSLLHKRLSVIRKTEDTEEIERRIEAARVEIEIIQCQKSSFAAVIEVSGASETLVFDQVLEVLTPHLMRKGG